MRGGSGRKMRMWGRDPTSDAQRPPASDFEGLLRSSGRGWREFAHRQSGVVTVHGELPALAGEADREESAPLLAGFATSRDDEPDAARPLTRPRSSQLVPGCVDEFRPPDIGEDGPHLAQARQDATRRVGSRPVDLGT